MLKQQSPARLMGGQQGIVELGRLTGSIRCWIEITDDRGRMYHSPGQQRHI